MDDYFGLAADLARATFTLYPEAKPMDKKSSNPARQAALQAAAKLSVGEVADVVEALEEAIEFVKDHVDVVDGDYGVPAPNRAMRLLPILEAAFPKAES